MPPGPARLCRCAAEPEAAPAPRLQALGSSGTFPACECGIQSWGPACAITGSRRHHWAMSVAQHGGAVRHPRCHPRARPFPDRVPKRRLRRRRMPLTAGLAVVPPRLQRALPGAWPVQLCHRSTPRGHRGLAARAPTWAPLRYACAPQPACACLCPATQQCGANPSASPVPQACLRPTACPPARWTI